MPIAEISPADTDWLLETSSGSSDFLSGSTQVGSIDLAPSSPPSLSDEVAYISGVYPDGTLPLYAFAAWNNDNPATYGGGGTTSYKWGAPTAGTGGGTVAYYFDPASNWSGTEQTTLAGGLALWSAVANISFVLTTDVSQAKIKFVRGTDGQANTGGGLSGTTGAGVTGGTKLWTPTVTTISIDTSVNGWGPIDGNFLTAGGFPTLTYLHEEGHALGLGHGGAYNTTAVASQQFSQYDTNLWTVMSYFDPGTGQYTDSNASGLIWDNRNPTGLMPLDILAIQALYGAPTSTPLSGGQVFGFNTNISGPLGAFFDFTKNSKPILALWDAGGNNTLDLSGFSAGSVVNLNPGTFSSVGGLQKNLAIAYNTSITTYIGGSGSDTVTGTAGDDLIRPNGGGGTFDGGAGFDTLSCEGLSQVTGNTIRLYDTGLQKFTVLGSITLTGIEGLIGANSSDTFYGTSGDNILRGMDGNDFLSGGLTSANGNDTLDGGNGIDTAMYSGGPVTVDLSLTGPQNTGSDGMDTLISIENVFGSSYDDTLKGNGGNNALDGGRGRDIAVFGGAAGAAALTHNSDGSWSVTTSGGGTDTLTNIETANFTDHAIALISKLDYDGSGAADLLWRNTNGTLDAWLTGAGAVYNFTDANQGIIDTGWQVAQIADFNLDNKLDILWRHSGGNTNVWLANSGAGMTGYTGQGLGIIDNAWHIQTTGDFTGDGKADIVGRNDDGTVNVWDSKTTGPPPSFNGFTGQGFATIDNSWIIKGSGDFNGNGIDDILWWNTNGSVNIWFGAAMPGDQTAFTGVNLGIVPTDWSIQGIGDFNGDRKDDILWRNASGQVNVWLSNTGADFDLSGPTSGFNGFTGNDLGLIPTEWMISKVGDFNGDAKADIAWRHSPDGDVNIWMSNAGYGFLGLTGQDVGIVSADWSII